MEKHPNSHLFRMKSILTNVTKKIPLAMKCTLLMLFVCVGLAFAGNGYAQNTLLDLSMENKTVDEVLSEIQKNTGFVLPQYEWGSDDIAEVPDEDYRYFNCILRDILLYQGASEEDIAQNSPRYQRYCIAKEFWDSVC